MLTHVQWRSRSVAGFAAFTILSLLALSSATAQVPEANEADPDQNSEVAARESSSTGAPEGDKFQDCLEKFGMTKEGVERLDFVRTLCDGSSTVDPGQTTAHVPDILIEESEMMFGPAM